MPEIFLAPVGKETNKKGARQAGEHRLDRPLHRGPVRAHLSSGWSLGRTHLVSDEHDDDVLVGVVAQLLQPPQDVVVRTALRDVVHQQGADWNDARETKGGEERSTHE